MKKILLIVVLMIFAASAFANTATNTSTATVTYTTTATSTITPTNTKTYTATATPTRTWQFAVSAVKTPPSAMTKGQLFTMQYKVTSYTKTMQQGLFTVTAPPYLYYQLTSGTAWTNKYGVTSTTSQEIDYAFTNLLSTTAKTFTLIGYNKITGAAGVTASFVANAKGIGTPWNSPTAITNTYQNATYTITPSASVTKTVTQTVTITITLTPTATKTVAVQATVVDVASNTIAVQIATGNGAAIKIVPEGGDITSSARTITIYMGTACDSNGTTVFTRTYNIGESVPAEINLGNIWTWQINYWFGHPFCNGMYAITSNRIQVYYRK